MKRRTAPAHAVTLKPADCTPDGRETIEHFLARGGRIQVIPATPASPARTAPVFESFGKGLVHRQVVGGC